ncbi:MAG: LacI family DNA-binding transcriptional regulator [Planctomycetota bacterium]
MPSLQQIADELSVSVSLVSKVLNNRLGTTGARPELAARIHDTAQRLGYRKNLNAAALKAGRQQAIAVLIHRHGSQGSGLVEALLAGISHATRQRHQRQILSFYDGIAEFAEIVHEYHTGMIDGLIVSGVRHPNLMDELLGLHSRGLPIVTVFNRPISDVLPNVGTPDDQIILAAMRHLIALGRRRILHVSSLKDREVGYDLGLKEAGLERDEDLVFYDRGDDNTFVLENGVRAVRRALANNVAFDAVCAQSDTQALGAMHELIRAGKRIPEDIVVTGVDDSPFARLAFVPLTSVDQRYEDRGQQAVELLDRLVRQQPTQSIDFEPVLNVRQSTEPANADPESTVNDQRTTN